jgi:choline dehydrogenase-like flavoprotein
MQNKVDVLIIGAGASGAAVAWSLAETKMRILCLEQGDWMKQSDYPTNGRDYEARVFSDYAISPNIRQRPSDYPINDDNSPIKVVNFNAVGGSTVMYTAHWTNPLRGSHDFGHGSISPGGSAISIRGFL